MKQYGATLLKALVGSHAYGLSTPASDKDYLGIFALPTIDLVGLNSYDESLVTQNPDTTMHEAGKYARLALKVNPTITELMWLPEDGYVTTHYLGDDLIDIRTAFLSKSYVRNAYLGYATAQFKGLCSRGGSFGADLHKRTEKHSRHLWRLCKQGMDLWEHQGLTVALPGAQALECREFGQMVAAEANKNEFRTAQRFMDQAVAKFDTLKTSLPDEPDFDKVQLWLQAVRREFWYD